MPDGLLAFAVAAAGIGVIGVVVGMLIAPALTRLIDRDEGSDVDR